MTSDCVFAPQLFLLNVSQGVEFYKHAFGAKELRRWENPDGSVHVSELTIGDAMFHLHEEVQRHAQSSAEKLQGTTVLLGLFVSDPDTLFDRAVLAGAKVINAMQDYDYGYRQGTLRDPFGHQWMIEKKLNVKS